MVSFPMSRAFVTPAAMCMIPSSPGEMCTCMSHSPGISIFPAASMTVAPAGIFVFPSRPTAVMRSPVITTVIPGFTDADSATNNFAPRITSGPVGLCDSSRASRMYRSPRAFSCAAVIAGTAASQPAGTTLDHPDTEAKCSPLSSTQSGKGEKPNPPTS